MAVDLLILSGDSGFEFINQPLRIKKDVRAINNSMYEFHSFLGMRTLGPHKAGWAARRHGYTTQVITKIQLLAFDDLISFCEQLVDSNTVIGIGTSLINYPKHDYSPETFKSKLTPDGVIIKLLKLINYYRRKHNTKIVVGGANSAIFKKIFNADYTIQGQAENELPKLLDRIKRSGIQKKMYDWDITRCDFQWHPSDCIVPKEVLPIETSRGCIFNCKFCHFENINKKIGTFERSLECVKQEFISNYQKYQTTHYWLMDDTFNDNDERVNQFCEMVESLPFRIHFMGYLRLDLAHKFQETTRRLYRAGLAGCSIGIESFHPEAAKAVDKPFSAKHGKQFLDYFYHDICESNITINCCNIVGLPGESKAHITESIRWYSARPHIHTNWSALYINDPARVDPDEILSGFEKDIEKHGFVFFSDKDKNYWEREGMNSDQAERMRRRIVQDMKPQNVDAGEPWVSMHYLSILNLMPKQAREIGWMKIHLRETERIRSHNIRYFSLLKKYLQEQKGL